jgi:hypothetical protein
VAIPIAAAIQIALKDLWQNRNSTVMGVSGDPLTAPGGETPPRQVELPPGTGVERET